MTAEKLMHELNQKCGIDFNNNRRALAVEIIDAALNEFAGLNMGLSTGADTPGFYMPYDRVDVSDPSIPIPSTLSAVPTVAEAIQENS